MCYITIIQQLSTLRFIYASSVSLIVYASHRCQVRSFSALHSINGKSFLIYHKPLRLLNNKSFTAIYMYTCTNQFDLVNEFMHLVVSARHCLANLLQLTNQVSQQRRRSTICTHYELCVDVRRCTCTTITCKTTDCMVINE